MTELKAQYPIANVSAVTFPTFNDMKFVFELTCPKTPFVITLSANDEDDFNEWIEQLNWRIMAHHRYPQPIR